MNLIVNADKNWGIGKNNELLVHIPNDMKMFRQMTTGKVVVMGRKTLESFPNGMPLPKRTNIVLTHDKDYDAKGAIVVGSKEELLDELEEYKDEDIFIIGGESLIQIYLNGSSDGGDLAAALRYGRQYMLVMLCGLPAFMMVQTYASTLRECGETMVPMKAGVTAVLVNLVFNYLLIYGKFGFPELGVVGAAIATVLSRYVEMAIVLIWTHKHKEINTYIVGLYKTMKIPGYLIKKFIIKGSPLLFNETLWAAAQATLMQCYSVRGLSVVAAFNIANTIANLFNVVFIALGDSVAIVVGQRLGAGKMDEARDLDNKMIAFSVMCCTGVAIVMFLIAPLFPQLYNTDSTTRHLAEYLIMTQAVFMPQNAFLHATYFTLRSGGKTVVTFFFDSVFVWIVSVPIAFVLSRFTGLFVVVIFACVNIADWIKCVIGFVLVKKGVWLQNIVSQKE